MIQLNVDLRYEISVVMVVVVMCLCGGNQVVDSIIMFVFCIVGMVIEIRNLVNVMSVVFIWGGDGMSLQMIVKS